MSEPGDSRWKWFPSIKTDWSLDVVNLLVVIGESSMMEHTQPITASLLCMLPRIIPAPQVFLKPTRPVRMPEVSAKMTGVYSGTTLDSVGFFANIITPLDDLHPLSFQVLDIRHSDKCRREEMADPDTPGHADEGWFGGLMATLAPLAGLRHSRDEMRRRRSAMKKNRKARKHPARDEEEMTVPDQGPAVARTSARDFGTQSNGGDSIADGDSSDTATLFRRKTTRQAVQDLLSHPTMAVGGERPAVPPHLFSPIHLLGLVSCLVSVAIIVCAVRWEDGNAILSVSLVSIMASIVGYASFWQPLLMSRRHTNQVPAGDVMIRTREGAFVLVRCTEDVARELYSGTEECRYYVNGRTYRFLMAVGTVLLMISVVLLGNCTWNSQVFIGTSYIILNGLYWALGMLPRSYFWDLSRYEWHNVTPPDAQGADEVTNPEDQREGHPSYTRTLWYAIRETRRTGWVQISGAAPGTDQWRKWLAEAEQHARAGDRSWNAVGRKNSIMDVRQADKEGLDFGDQAMNCAPATQIPSGPYNNTVPNSPTF